MSPRVFRRAVLPVTVAATMIATVASPAVARPDDGSQGVRLAAPGAAVRVSAITDDLARQLARSLADPTVADRVVSAAVAGPVDLATLDLGQSFRRASQDANRGVLVAKGLPATSGSLLRVRLAHLGADGVLDPGEVPLVAATPTDDDLTEVTAYDTSGAPVGLSATRAPQQAVLAVEVDTTKALPIGLQVLRETLDAHGVGSAQAMSTGMVTAAGGYWANKVTAVRLNDDKEPWIKDDAEIFNVVGGFGLDGKVKIDTVTMPYLDHDNTTYYPNQLIVHYSAYKYNLADVVMYEDDGDTNYLNLAKAIAAALLFIVDGGAYTPVVHAIMDAMPSSWWTDDPDYVDSWYTLATTTSGRRYGAAGNGWMDITPYWVPAL